MAAREGGFDAVEHGASAIRPTGRALASVVRWLLAPVVSPRASRAKGARQAPWLADGHERERRTELFAWIHP